MENMKTFLQDMIDDFRFEDLPPNWNSFDLESFSRNKKLWDYQQSTLKNAIKVLWKYFEDFVDYNENEKLEVRINRENKNFSIGIGITVWM
jgi:type III restriction enzyme